MRPLLIYAKFKESYGSFEKVMELTGKRAMMPPVGLITVAAILPQDWQFRLVERNIQDIIDEDRDWAEIVLFSGVLVQKAGLHTTISEAQARGEPTAAVGPYASSCRPEMQQAGADYLLRTLPMSTWRVFMCCLIRVDIWDGPTGIFAYWVPRGGIGSLLTLAVDLEHFLSYHEIVKLEIEKTVG